MILAGLPHDQKSEHDEPSDDFKPSPILTNKLLEVLFLEGIISKTLLCQKANIHYKKLVKHLDWLQRKKVVEYVLSNGKVAVQLTVLGRELSEKILWLYS